MGTDFTQGKIGKNLFFFTLPLLLSSLIQQLYGTVNLIIVGKFLGTKSCAAVGASDLIITCLIGFFYGMAVGANVVAAHLIGENAQGKLKKLIETVVILGFVGGI
ncbi:MAG: MATE family efflux transporter, partial [Clostridiales bacterium]